MVASIVLRVAQAFLPVWRLLALHDADVLLEAGKGNLIPAAIEARLRPGCAIPAGPSAPARGLFLVGVEYESDDS